MALALSLSVSSCKESKETDSLTDETEQLNEMRMIMSFT